MSSRIFVSVCTLALLFAPAFGDETATVPADKSPMPVTADMTELAAVEFVQTYCLDCHQADAPEADLNLEDFASTTDVVDAIKQWNKIADRVRDSQMPPDDSDAPSRETRMAFVAWIGKTIHAAICDDGIAPGAPMLRRLNRHEYANTVRDLLGIHINAGHALPVDGAGGEGFDNASETLFVSPIHVEKYLDAAKSALNHALTDPGIRDRIMTAKSSDDRQPQADARDVLSAFLPRAFRRPIRSTELDEYTDLFLLAYEEDENFAAAIQFSLEAALVSPKFLFLWEEPSQQEGPVLISQYEMASRLSYFMWASMPDTKLMELAAAGKLHEEEVLVEQVVRMLRSDLDGQGLRKGAKVREFAASFTEQWLGTRALGREFQPDRAVSHRYDSELEGGMKYEPVFFFEDLLADNRSLLNLIDADFTYVNRRLAEHYQVPGEFREQPKKVDLPADSHRGGLLGMSAVLAISSHPHRTSPVLRGKWILETLLGTPPPPPPPNVGELEEANSEKPTSLRERLELHRADSACASCHATMDPLGFGLENFDVLGRWRTEVDGIPIDARGELPDGTTFDGPADLKRLLLDRKQQFIRHFTSKMLGYALARELTNEDDCVAESIVETLAENDYRSHTLIIEIVKSVPFRYKQGKNRQAAVVNVRPVAHDSAEVGGTNPPPPIKEERLSDE